MCFTGTAALLLYDVPHPPPQPEVVRVIVPVPRDPLQLPGTQIVRAGAADLSGMRRIRDHPIASLEVALRHSAQEVARQKMITLLQDQLRLRGTTEQRLRSATGRGRAGSTALRRALDVAGDRAHSRQERRVHRRMVERGIGGYQRGANLLTGLGVSYWLDFLWRSLLAGLEVNGGLHFDPVQAGYDARRARRVLTEHGVVLMMLADGSADADGAVDEVVAFLRSRADRLGVPRSAFEH